SRLPEEAPLTEFHLGIIGGCSSHQRYTPLSVLYHRQLAELLAADPGVRLRPHVVRAFDRPYAERLDQLLAGPPIDSVMLHIRVSMVIQSRLLMTRYEHGRPRPSFNPALFRRTHSPRSGATPTGALHEPDAYGDGPFYDQDLPRPGRRIAGFRLRNLTHLLGALAGLDRWAIEEDMLGLDAIVQACEDRGVPLIVLGPTPASSSYWSQRVIRRTNAAIRRRLTGTGVPFALIDGLRDAEGRPITRVDGLHLTPAGHRYVAERLYEAGMRELAGHQRARVE
ncbi:MAG TPA: SGNH/GDSL hydrolase family protein, partial [Candidatus Limnocylindrales bacterium]